eukprot:3073387-Rhodomonas_salina.1
MQLRKWTESESAAAWAGWSCDQRTVNVTRTCTSRRCKLGGKAASGTGTGTPGTPVGIPDTQCDRPRPPIGRSKGAQATDPH